VFLQRIIRIRSSRLTIYPFLVVELSFDWDNV